MLSYYSIHFKNSLGMLIIVHPSIAVIWIVLVAVMFWKILFPFNARLHWKLDKWIHALVPVLGENIIPFHNLHDYRISHPIFIRYVIQYWELVAAVF